MKWLLQNTYASLPQPLFTPQAMMPVTAPKLVVFNDVLAQELGLGAYDETIDLPIFAGNKTPSGSSPIAQAYCGHQFGHFANLGDGRAMLLGEIISPSNQRYDIQLKGSGPTVYARRGDGRASLGSMLREYLISEAMHALGVPTTRSLAVVTTGDLVYRVKPLAGAVLTRLAASHIRVGTFAYAAELQDRSVSKMLADYTIERHFSDLPVSGERYFDFLKAVCERQASLIAKWMHLGFIHGVMNTDNMAISGETIDFGPCAFMDTYSADTVFSSIDTQGRYRYANQPSIGLWNLERFAESILPLLNDERDVAIKQAGEALRTYVEHFDMAWLTGMRAKLGIMDASDDDADVISDWFMLLDKYKADFTYAHRSLSSVALPPYPLFQSDEFLRWHAQWMKCIQRNGRSMNDAYNLMQQHNPAVIPRNHLVEAALLSAEADDLGPLHEILNALKEPFANLPSHKVYTEPPHVDQSGYQTFCGT